MELSSSLTHLTRPPGWTRSRPWIFDGLLAIALALVGVAVVFGAGENFPGTDQPSNVGQWLILFGPAMAVPFRRMLPTTAVIVGALLQCVLWVTALPDFYLAMAFLIHAGAAYGGQRGRRASWAAAVGLTAYAGFGVLVGEAPAYAPPFVALSSVAAVALGISMANGDAYTKAVEAGARDMARSQEAEKQRVLTEERNRIARELHDVVAHGLSVIVVQSAAAQRILERDPDGARSALQQIEQTGRTSLTEMRHVLSVVRTDPDESWRPAPGLAGLDELIAELGKAGLDVSLTETGDDRPESLPATVDMTAYRIVQESLTNVLKHGGHGASAKVEINHKPGSIGLSVLDNGRGSAAEDGGGHGLRGMQERVEVFGGSFSAGPRLSGGFEVNVSLPLDNARATS